MPNEISLDLEANSKVIRPDKIASSSSTIPRENEEKHTWRQRFVIPNVMTCCREMAGVITVRKHNEGHHHRLWSASIGNLSKSGGSDQAYREAVSTTILPNLPPSSI
jgi:hypothetical protein